MTRAQQDDALAPVEGLLQMFEAFEARDSRMCPIAGPAAEPHLDHRHAERLEVARCQRVTFCCRQFGKSQLDIATHDGAAAAGKPLRDPAEHAADRERGTMRQQAEQA